MKYERGTKKKRELAKNERGTREASETETGRKDLTTTQLQPRPIN